MKTELAERLLGTVMEWDIKRYKEEIKYVQAISTYKYDDYQQFSPGMKFIESLALWLNQFKNEEKEIAYNFVKNNLIFISKKEMEHLIEIAYSDIVNQIMIKRTAEIEDIPEHKIKKIVSSKEYKKIKRKSLFLGLSDGAHLDIFRRAHELNNEQVLLSYQFDSDKLEEMEKDLKKYLSILDNDIKDEDCTFDFIFLLDDFAGSSDSTLRKETEIKFNEIPSELNKEENIEWGGKLWYKKSEKKLVYKGEMSDIDYEKLKSMSEYPEYQKNLLRLYKETKKTNKEELHGKLAKILSKLKEFQEKGINIFKNTRIVIIFYVSTQKALETLGSRVKSYRKSWWPKIDIATVLEIKNELKVTETDDGKFEKLLEDYYDEEIMNKHLLKGGPDVKHGYGSCSLPLILFHNTPNNSVYLLWCAKNLTPLFKRIDRHKVE